MLPQMNRQDPGLSRTAWAALEPYHAMNYFAPEVRTASTAAGLKGYWMGYFASRSAALGPVPASVVTALFYNFHPRMVTRALPDAWRFSSPEQVLEARLQGVDLALRRLLGEQAASVEVAEAAELAREAAIVCPLEGRALFAAYHALPWPTQPHLVLWHAATLLREFRGDGHVATLLAEGIDGCEAHLLLVGAGNISRAMVQPDRGWSDEEWGAAQRRLVDRGLLDDSGQFTSAGKSLHQLIEDRTDQLALPPWQHLGERAARLIALMRPLSTKIIDEGGVPVPNPIGAPQP